MFLTSNEQASGHPVKSPTSKLAGALRTTKAQLVLQDLVSFTILAGVKCSKGNFTMDPFNELQSATAICATRKQREDNSCLFFGWCFDPNASRATTQANEHTADAVAKVQVASELHGSSLSALIPGAASWPAL